MKKLHKGFTVFELIIAIVVIATLSAILVPSFVGLTSNTKVSADRSLVNMLNNSININFNETGSKPKTMHDAVRIVKKSSYTLDRLVTESNETLVFDTRDNFFHLSSDIAPENYSSCFAIYNSMPDLSTEGPHFSIYATEAFKATSIENLTVGFDVGYNTEINNISYVGTNDVVIRTSRGKLSINSNGGKVEHYGNVSEVHIEEVSSNSYFEEGTTTFMEVKKGRVVLTPSSSVGGIHLLKTDDSFDSISIGVVDELPLPTLTRDYMSKDSETISGTYDKYVACLQSLETRNDESPSLEHVWVRFDVNETHSTPSGVISSSNEEIDEIRADQQTDAAKDAALYLTSGTTAADAEEEAIVVIEPEVLSGSVVRSGAIGYDSLEEAIEKSSNGKMLTMLQNVTLEEPLTIDKELILNLNGKTITTGANAITISDGSLLIKDSVSGGKITGSASPLVHALNSTINLYSGSIVSTGAIALEIELSSFSMTGGKLQSASNTLKLINFVACDISGGTITNSYSGSGSYIVYCSSQTENITAEVHIHGSVTITASKGPGIRVKRLKIYESPKITTKYYSVRCEGVTNISGGTIKSTGNYATLYVDSSGNLTVSGGTITSKSGYKKATIGANANGIIKAETLDVIAIRDMSFEAITFEQDGYTPVAFGTCYSLCQNTLSDGKIVKLYADVNFSVSKYVNITKSITLDLNGHNITQATASATALFLFKITAAEVTIRGEGVCSYTEPDSLASKTCELFYIASTAVHTINIEGGTFEYHSNTANRMYFYIHSNGSGTNNFNFKGGKFGHSGYITGQMIYVRTSTIYKREYFYFTGGSFYGFDPDNHGTSYKINIPTGYASSLNEETGYYDVGPTA